MNEPYEIMTQVITHPAADPTPGRQHIDAMTGIVSDYSPTSHGSYRYVVMFTAEEWNRSGRRETDQVETLRFYSGELTPTGTMEATQ